MKRFKPAVNNGLLYPSIAGLLLGAIAGMNGASVAVVIGMLACPVRYFLKSEQSKTWKKLSVTALVVLSGMLSGSLGGIITSDIFHETISSKEGKKEDKKTDNKKKEESVSVSKSAKKYPTKAVTKPIEYPTTAVTKTVKSSANKPASVRSLDSIIKSCQSSKGGKVVDVSNRLAKVFIREARWSRIVSDDFKFWSLLSSSNEIVTLTYNGFGYSCNINKGEMLNVPHEGCSRKNVYGQSFGSLPGFVCRGKKYVDNSGRLIRLMCEGRSRDYPLNSNNPYCRVEIDGYPI